MEVQFKAMPGLYCDEGRHEGKMRVDFGGSAYMSPEEYQEYEKNGMTMVIMKGEA